jgi:hypothetical protein
MIDDEESEMYSSKGLDNGRCMEFKQAISKDLPQNDLCPLASK